METLSSFETFRMAAMIILGATGVYLLLPHSHGRTKPKLAHQVGYACSGISLLAFMSFWRTTDVQLITKAFFYIFALAAVGCAVLTITSRDPIHSALWFAAVVLATSGLFLLSGAQFLAAGTVIVYAGAIIVTFLFVIMLAQKEGRAIYDRMARAPFLATLSGFLLMFGLVYALLAIRAQPDTSAGSSGLTAISYGNRVISATERMRGMSRMSPRQILVLNRALPPTSRLPEAGGLSADGSHVAGLGATLYTEHLVTVELAGALLFAALIGAIAIATPRTPIRPTMGIVVNAMPTEAPTS